MVKKYYPPFLINGVLTLAIPLIYTQLEGLGAYLALVSVFLIACGINTWLCIVKLLRKEWVLGTIYSVVAVGTFLFLSSAEVPYAD
jgi:uncharacterized membrane protein YidH (DUF202 family)